MDKIDYYFLTDIIGLIGVVLVLAAYYFLNISRIKPIDMSYLLMNFIGSCLILFSLMFTWNLSSVIIEIAWIFVSLIGIYRVVKMKSSKRKH